MTVKPQAPAAERNKQPILEVLKSEFRECESVLEIGSGTGQHAVYFAEALPWLTWQTSDLAENHRGISAWIADSGLSNVLDPMQLDVEAAPELGSKYDGVFSANTAHIMRMQAVRCMFDVVGRVLRDGDVFCLYGPFNHGGKFSSESNKGFDASLRGQDQAMGIRDLEDLDEFAARSMMCRDKLYAMPANNLLAVWTINGVRTRK